MSQFASDIVAIISLLMFWFPAFGLLIAFLINLIYCGVQDEHLKKDYLRSLNPDERKVIEDYLEATSFVRVQRRKRRLAQLVHGKFNNDKHDR